MSHQNIEPQPFASDDATDLHVGEVFERVPVTKEHFKSGLALFIVFAIDAWEMMIIVYASTLIAKEFTLSPVQIGTLIGAIFVGMTVGSIIWGPICERIGRRTTIIRSLILYGIISFISTYSTSYEMLYATRFLSGVAASGMFVTTFPLFEELLPVKVRGKYTVYLAAGWPVGMLLALASTVVLTPFGWRWVLTASALASTWAFVVARWVPESPYWLVGAGQEPQARAVIHRLSANKFTIPANRKLVVENIARGSTFSVFKRGLLFVTVLQILINFAFSWGYWGLQTWLPTLLAQRGLSLPESYGFIALSAVCMIPGYITASFLTARFGRKWVMIAYVAISAVAGFGFANAASAEALYACNLILAFFSLGAWGVWDTWIGELYPTQVRVVGNSWAVFAQRLANTIAPTVVGVLVAQSASFNTTVTFINMFLFATAVLALFLPETEGKDLH